MTNSNRTKDSSFGRAMSSRLERGVPSRGYVRIPIAVRRRQVCFSKPKNWWLRRDPAPSNCGCSCRRHRRATCLFAIGCWSRTRPGPRPPPPASTTLDTPGELVFSEGELEQIINIEILEDDLVEEIGELFVVELFEPTGLVTTSPSMVTVWIEDNEPRPIIAYLEPGYIEVNEGDDSIEFLVQLTGEPMAPVSVRYQTIAGEREARTRFCGRGRCARVCRRPVGAVLPDPTGE